MKNRVLKILGLTALSTASLILGMAVAKRTIYKEDKEDTEEFENDVINGGHIKR